MTYIKNLRRRRGLRRRFYLGVCYCSLSFDKGNSSVVDLEEVDTA